MELLKRYKVAIIGTIVVVVLFAIYAIYFTGGEEVALVRDSERGVIGADERELLSLLSSLQSVKLDETLFNAPEFHSLIDFSRELLPEAIGRRNPFAPYGTF